MEKVLTNLHKTLSNKHNFKHSKISKTLSYLKSFSFILSNACIKETLPLIERLSYLLNLNLKHHILSRLKFSKSILESWLVSAASNSVHVPELIPKLLIITNLNLSFYYQSVQNSKSFKYTVESLKLAKTSKLKSTRGRLLTFICRLRLSELYILNEKFEIAIKCCEQVLNEIQAKLLMKKAAKSRVIEELAMTSITALFRIAMCRRMIGDEDRAVEAFVSADKIGKEYLDKKGILFDLSYEKKIFDNFKRKENKVKAGLAETKDCGNVEDKESTSLSRSMKSKERVKEVDGFKGANRIDKASDSVELGLELKRSKSQDVSPVKYYSAERLNKLKEILENEESEKILTTDQFFFKKMTKQLGIEISEKSLSPEPKNYSDTQRLEIKKLRNKKSFIQIPRSHSPENLDKKIDWFEEICENNMKFQEIKMRNTLKTKVYKSILKTINFKFDKNRIIPNQRLYFSPPSKYHLTSPKQNRPLLQRRLTIVKRKVKEFNLEIEDQIGILNKDFDSSIKFVKSNTSSSKSFGGLAKSTIKTKLKPAQIQKSIYSVFNKNTSLL